MTALITALFVIGIGIGVFLVCRQIFLWYWRINESVEIQKNTNELLRILINELREERNSKTTKEQ